MNFWISAWAWLLCRQVTYWVVITWQFMQVSGALLR